MTIFSNTIRNKDSVALGNKVTWLQISETNHWFINLVSSSITNQSEVVILTRTNRRKLFVSRDCRPLCRVVTVLTLCLLLFFRWFLFYDKEIMFKLLTVNFSNASE